MTKDISRRGARRWIAIAMLTAFGAVLGGCSGGGLGNFDPTDMLDFLDTKKKLPGQRKLVFPEGVPGLQPGVPKDLYKGAQAEPEPAPVEPAVSEPKGRKAVKSRTASRSPANQPRAIAPAEAEPEEGASAAAPPPPKDARPRVVRRRTTAPPPEEPAATPAPQAARPAPAPSTQSASSPFPAPLPSGSFSR